MICSSNTVFSTMTPSSLAIQMYQWKEYESIYYRDRQHMNEVMVKMEKDERVGQMMKQSMDLLPLGAKFIVGDFERLSV